MDKQAVIRRVRIAVSVFFGVLTLALCLLWVRSYWRVEMAWVRVSTNRIGLGLLPGAVGISLDKELITAPRLRIFPSNDVDEWLASGPYPSRVWGMADIDSRGVIAPCWLLTLLSVALAAAPWLSRRFSLRTMLIATTLVAVVLGLGVWLAR